jgi:preprotein translocase subunit YajC
MQLLTLLMSPQAGADQNPIVSLLPWIGVIVIFYFFMIRPQAKKAKEAKAFRENLEKGTKVVTIGGIHGKILEVTDTNVLIDCDGSKLRVEKSDIAVNGKSGLEPTK